MWYLTAEEHYLDRRPKQLFFGGVRDFYISVASTIISFDDKVVDDVANLMPENRPSVDVAAVSWLVQTFPAAISQEAHDDYEEEVLDYKLTMSSQLSSVYKEKDKPSKSAELCTYWQEVAIIKTLTGTRRFPYLSRLAKC